MQWKNPKTSVQQSGEKSFVCFQGAPTGRFPGGRIERAILYVIRIVQYQNICCKWMSAWRAVADCGPLLIFFVKLCVKTGISRVVLFTVVYALGQK